MKLLRKISSLYATYRRLLWLTGILGTTMPTMLGYMAYILQTLKTRRTMMEDDPEYARDIPLWNPVEWLEQAKGWIPLIVKAMAILGIIMLIIAVASFIVHRTQVSGRDRSLKDKAEMEDAEEDYEYDDNPMYEDNRERAWQV